MLCSVTVTSSVTNSVTCQHYISQHPSWSPPVLSLLSPHLLLIILAPALCHQHSLYQPASPSHQCLVSSILLQMDLLRKVRLLTWTFTWESPVSCSSFACAKNPLQSSPAKSLSPFIKSPLSGSCCFPTLCFNKHCLHITICLLPSVCDTSAISSRFW